MALKAENFFVEFSPGLYLDSRGKIVDKLPATNSVHPLPVQLNLPQDVKGLLKDVELADVSKALKDASPVLSELGIDRQVVDIVSASINLVIGLASVYGTIGAVANLAQALGILGAKPEQNLLASLHKKVYDIHELLLDEYKEETMARVEGMWKIVDESWLGINEYLEDDVVTELDRENLRTHTRELRRATLGLLRPSEQRHIFSLSFFAGKPWYPYTTWLQLHPDARFEDGFDTRGVDLQRLAADPEKAFRRWDYTPYIAVMFEAVSLLLVAYKALDPAFRTTRRFERDLRILAQRVQAFGDMIVRHIVWTREWDRAVTDILEDRLAAGWPVGAVNACTGASDMTPNWKEGIETIPAAHAIFEGMVRITNMDESLARVRRKRYGHWLAMLGSSGAPQVLHMAKVLEELSTVPETSETVEVRTTAVAQRTFVEKRKQKTPATLACDPLAFTAALHHVQRKVTMHATLQPRRYQDHYIIPYTFAVESYRTTSGLHAVLDAPPLDRVVLTPGSGTITLEQVESFDWEVKSSSLAIKLSGATIQKITELRQDKRVLFAKEHPEIFQDHPLARPTLPAFAALDEDLPGVPRNFARRQVTMDYALDRQDGAAIIQFGNLPAEGNFAGVFLVIEEKPKGLDSRIRTFVEISMVGQELHLPPEYFDYLAMCEARSRVIVKEIEHQFQLQQKPIPPWDPQTSPMIHDWVRQVLKQHPTVLKGELLKQARILAGPSKIKPIP